MFMLAIIKVSLVKQANHNQTMQTDSDMVTVGQTHRCTDMQIDADRHGHSRTPLTEPTDLLTKLCRQTWSQWDFTHRANRSLDLAPVPPDGGLSCDQFALHPLHLGSSSRSGLPCLKPCTHRVGVRHRVRHNHGHRHGHGHGHGHGHRHRHTQI